MITFYTLYRKKYITKVNQQKREIFTPVIIMASLIKYQTCCNYNPLNIIGMCVDTNIKTIS